LGCVSPFTLVFQFPEAAMFLYVLTFSNGWREKHQWQRRLEGRLPCLICRLSFALYSKYEKASDNQATSCNPCSSAVGFFLEPEDRHCSRDAVSMGVTESQPCSIPGLFFFSPGTWTHRFACSTTWASPPCWILWPLSSSAHHLPPSPGVLPSPVHWDVFLGIQCLLNAGNSPAVWAPAIPQALQTHSAILQEEEPTPTRAHWVPDTALSTLKFWRLNVVEQWQFYTVQLHTVITSYRSSRGRLFR
jgi:hypothetical protein